MPNDVFLEIAQPSTWVLNPAARRLYYVGFVLGTHETHRNLRNAPHVFIELLKSSEFSKTLRIPMIVDRQPYRTVLRSGLRTVCHSTECGTAGRGWRGQNEVVSVPY